MLHNSNKFVICRGFTLLEVTIAITVMTMAVAGSFILIQQTLAAGSLVQSKLIAGYLIQEGFEIVRNIRDTNWLQSRDPTKTSPWDDGLICLAPPCEWQGDYTTVTFTSTSDFEKCTDEGYNCYAYDGAFFYIDGTTGFYRYIVSPGPDDIKTPFKRKITITEIDADSIMVEILVSWQERGRPHLLPAREYLYNWKP